MRGAGTIAAAAALALAGCAGAPAPAPIRTPAAAAPARGGVVRVPQVMAAQGLEGVIGQGAAALTRRFGPPRLDVPEGDVRKLQFAGSACVLDIYLYPLSPGAEPTASHVAARVRQGGAPADAGACIREIERR
jgi:hypothetical protein